MHRPMHPRFRRPQHGEQDLLRNRHLQDATLDGIGDEIWSIQEDGSTESLEKEGDKWLCQRALQRLRHEKDDIGSLFKEYDLYGKKYDDVTFDFPESIHWESNPTIIPADSKVKDVENLVWERISEYLSAKDGYSLWGSNDIESSDAIQGQLGNCWLVTAAMSIAKQPGRLKEIFKVQELNDAGVYALDLWLLGMPITVLLDDKLPLNKESLMP